MKRIHSLIYVAALAVPIASFGNWAWSSQGAPPGDDLEPMFHAVLEPMASPPTQGEAELTISFDSGLTRANVELRFDALSSPFTGAHLRVGQQAGAGPSVLSLTTAGACSAVSGQVTQGVVNCTFTDAHVVPCSNCGDGGGPIQNIADVAFAMENDRVRTELRSQAFPTGELGAELGLKIKWHFRGCNTKTLEDGSTFHLAPCSSATITIFGKEPKMDEVLSF